MKCKELIPLARSLGYLVDDSGDRPGFSLKINGRKLSFMWDRGNYCDNRFSGDPDDCENLEMWNYFRGVEPRGYVDAYAVADMLVVLSPKRKQRGA